MNEYELMTILNPRLNADETAAAVQTLEAQIAAHGGEVLSTDVWGRRRLAYPIRTHMEGTYVLFTLNLPPQGTAPLEAWLMVTESVLRHLLIRGIIPYQGHEREREREREFDRDAEREDRDDERGGRDERDDDRGGRDERDGRADALAEGDRDAEPEQAASAGAAVAVAELPQAEPADAPGPEDNAGIAADETPSTPAETPQA